MRISNNFDDMSFNDKIKLLGFDFNNHANNEQILDKLFLHGKYANQSIENLTSSDINQLKTALSEINNNNKIAIFSKLLRKDLISEAYYKTQIGRYGSLQIWCRFFILNQLPGDRIEKINNIEKLPLPNLLKRFLETSFALKDTQTQSPRP